MKLQQGVSCNFFLNCPLLWKTTMYFVPFCNSVEARKKIFRQMCARSAFTSLLHLVPVEVSVVGFRITLKMPHLY